MSKQTPANAAARAVAMAVGIAALVVIAILTYFGLLELNAWLALLIVGKENGHGAAAMFISLLGLEIATIVGIYRGVKAYQRARDE